MSTLDSELNASGISGHGGGYYYAYSVYGYYYYAYYQGYGNYGYYSYGHSYGYSYGSGYGYGYSAYETHFYGNAYQAGAHGEGYVVSDRYFPGTYIEAAYNSPYGPHYYYSGHYVSSWEWVTYSYGGHYDSGRYFSAEYGVNGYGAFYNQAYYVPAFYFGAEVPGYFHNYFG